MSTTIKSRKNRQFVVYMIRCITSGKCYVGSTDDEVRRMDDHFANLKRGSHHSIKLQRAYIKYGEQAFDFVICERGLLDFEVRQIELNWINRENSFKGGYNMTTFTGQGTTIPIEHRRKMSIGSKKAGKNPELRLKRSLQAKKQHAEGRFNYRKRIESKSKICQKCRVEFELERNSVTGTYRENKLCKPCSKTCSQSRRHDRWRFN